MKFVSPAPAGMHVPFNEVRTQPRQICRNSPDAPERLP